VPRNSNGPAEVQYEQAVEIAEKARAKADSAVSDTELRDAQQLADQLGFVLGDDTKGLDLAVQLAAALQEVQAANKKALDTAAALKDHLTKTHGPTHEAVQAAGTMAERGFHGH
jgi:hypothetical protein